MFGLIPYLWKIFYKVKLKQTLKKQIDIPLKELHASYSRFTDSIYMIHGACSVGIYNQPQINPTKKAQEMVSELKESYTDMVSNARKLLRIIKTHRDEFKEVLKPRDWMLIEVLIETFSKKKEVDIEYLLRDQLVNEAIKKQLKKRSDFLKKLNTGVKEFSKEEGISIIPTKYETVSETLRKVSVKWLSDPKSIEKTLKHLEKISK